MFKPTIVAFAATLALSAAPAMAGLIATNTVAANALTGNALTGNGLSSANTVVANGIGTHNTVVANGLLGQNTVVANGLLGDNTVVANGLSSANTPSDTAVARTEVHLVGATGAPVPTGGTIVLRLVAVEYLPE